MILNQSFKKKIVSDIFATLLASNVLANFMAYHLGNYEVEPPTFWLIFTIFVFLFLGGLVWLRRNKPQRRNFWDLIFPIFLLSLALLIFGVAFSVGDIYDKEFGKKLLDKVDSDAMRSLIDIYASGSQEALIVKPLGLALVLIGTVVSRLLGAWRTAAKQK
jgi:drug/metabolite transporter (DMT)-like permease